MTQLNFVRYAPEIETIDPDLDRLMEEIIAFWEKTVRESPVVEGSGRAVRGAHAKTTAWSKPRSRSCATCRPHTRKGFTRSQAATVR